MTVLSSKFTVFTKGGNRLIYAISDEYFTNQKREQFVEKVGFHYESAVSVSGACNKNGKNSYSHQIWGESMYSPHKLLEIRGPLLHGMNNACSPFWGVCIICKTSCSNK